VDTLNPHSREVLPLAYGEPALAEAAGGDRYQFERLGYFVRDPDTGEGGRPVFNRTVGLRDTWAKLRGKSGL
jgi:glutaminyl-tRNA synthetase